VAEEEQIEEVSAANESVQQPAVQGQQPGMSDKQRSILQAMLGDLKELRDMLKVEDKSE